MNKVHTSKNNVYKFIADSWVTAEVKDIASVLKVEDASFPGVMHKLSIYKPNKLPNSEFRGSPMGE